MFLLVIIIFYLSGVSDRGTKRQTRFRKFQTKGLHYGQYRLVGRGTGVGRSRADEGVVQRSRQSQSRGQTWVGARQMTETGIQGRRRL